MRAFLFLAKPDSQSVPPRAIDTEQTAGAPGGRGRGACCAPIKSYPNEMATIGFPGVIPSAALSAEGPAARRNSSRT
ncbi:hypothetical protein EVAR_49559_1 [Eumeta japonica]|uniref:Uncharacterized protein n=1 Tax=Eumeta variegata TaxID=151549 RepID=A0A4C1XLX7_EUMVA|nr:hypothetical protein EVAR_49559_1 [Eumeta japonica]